MGVCIELWLSRSVTETEWKRVYNETVSLVHAFPLAEAQEVNMHNCGIYCLIRSKEREIRRQDWFTDKTKSVTRGWIAEGDYDTLEVCEDYCLTLDRVKKEEEDPDACDAILCEARTFVDDTSDIESQVTQIWGSKTQGGFHHYYLLAIGCLIADRLGSKAYLSGDITRGQCRKAVDLANEYLDIKIQIPDRCDAQRLLSRISALELKEGEKLRIFMRSYLGTPDFMTGDLIRLNFHDEEITSYWKERFLRHRLGTIGFNHVFRDYMLLGFDLESLCKIIKFEDENEIPQYELFLQKVMDAGLHLQEKDCSNTVGIDLEDSRTYDQYKQLAQLTYAAYENPRIDRYIPMDEIREALKKGIGEAYPVETFINEYLKAESEKEMLTVDAFLALPEEEQKKISHLQRALLFEEAVAQRNREYANQSDAYDILDCEDLKYYEEGDTIQPDVENGLAQVYHFLEETVCTEKNYEELMRKSAKDCFTFLVRENQSLLIRDEDWERIYEHLHKDKQSFARYYPMVRIKISNDVVKNIILALVINDDLYLACKERYQSERSIS